MNKTKTKTKKLKESEFIRHIENNPVVLNGSMREIWNLYLKRLPMLYMFIAITSFLKIDYVQDDIHYDIVKNNLK